jgi:arylsulfatase A-like enzyme
MMRAPGTSQRAYAAIVLTALLATAFRYLLRSVAPLPYAPQVEGLALNLALYTLSLTPALLAFSLAPRFTRLGYLLLGAPFALMAIGLLFAAGVSSRGLLLMAGLIGFPAGILLRLMGSTRWLAVSTALCLVVGAGVRWHSPAVGKPGPSVLFVVLDTTATNHLSAYGYARPTTPALETLARRSLVYQRAISPAPWTIPAHAAMFSGHYPSELGFDGANFEEDPPPGSLANDLEASGRPAYAISANPLVASDGMLRSGYRALWQGDRLTRPLLLELLDRLRSREEFMTSGEQITDLALDWLDRLAPRGDPWFLFLNYVDPHMPYQPPEREHDEFARGIDADAVMAAAARYNSGLGPLEPETMEAMRALYDGEIASMDHALGRLLDELGRRGYDPTNLFIIVTADHGEALGEHGLIGHLRGLPDTVLHVPLLIAGPGITPGVIATAVQTVQLRATVRALLGLPTLPGIAPALPPWGTPPSLVITEYPEPPWRSAEETGWDPRSGFMSWAGNWVAVEHDGMKVVFDGHGGGRTYRLGRDPDEEHPQPLADGAPLVQAYTAWRERWSITPQVTSAEKRRALRSMGYVQ